MNRRQPLEVLLRRAEDEEERLRKEWERLDDKEQQLEERAKQLWEREKPLWEREKQLWEWEKQLWDVAMDKGSDNLPDHWDSYKKERDNLQEEKYSLRKDKDSFYKDQDSLRENRSILRQQWASFLKDKALLWQQKAEEAATAIAKRSQQDGKGLGSQEEEEEEVEGSQQDGSQEEEEEGCDELKDYTFRDLGITRERPERGQFGNVFKGWYDGRAAVIKLFHARVKGAEKAFRHERRMYTSFKELQGKLMPVLLCYGTLYPTDAFFLALSDEGQYLESLEAPISKLVVKQVCEVLHALHDAGICHGDVQAASFVQRPDGTVCAVDFERAVILDGLSSKQARAARQSDLQSLKCFRSSSGGYFRG